MPTGTGVDSNGGSGTQTPIEKMLGYLAFLCFLSTVTKPRGLVRPSIHLPSSPLRQSTPRKAGRNIVNFDAILCVFFCDPSSLNSVASTESALMRSIFAFVTHLMS